MKFSGNLKHGDTVLLIAPSSPLKNMSAEDCAAALEKYGYKTVIGDSLRETTARGYAAASAQTRANDINRGFMDDSIQAIWAMRGGSMAMEILPLLDYEMISQHPKQLIGFSDVTALHIALHQKAGITSCHAPCGSHFVGEGPDAYAMECFERVMGMQDTCEFINPEGQEIEILNAGIAEGELVGGNMTLVASLTGTEFALDTQGKILFLEDVDEDVYRVNRMLLQLKMSGMLDKAAGLLFGAFTDCNNGYHEEYKVEQLLREFFADYDKPIYTNLSVGHIRRNAALPMGTMCRMEGGKITFSVN